VARYDDILELEPNLAGRGLRVGIVMSRFNLDVCEGLLGACADELRKHQVQAANMLLVSVPGALEIPLTLLKLASSGRFDDKYSWRLNIAKVDPPEPIAARFPRTLSGAYDAEVATADVEVARLIDFLGAAHLLDATIVVLVGDHGESLGEHQEQQHGFFVYDASTQIPLIVAHPRRSTARHRRAPGDVGLRDNRSAPAAPRRRYAQGAATAP